MAAWDVSSALASLRSLLGDGANDKFTFKAPVYPTPDSVTTRFFCGERQVVPNSLSIYVNGVLTAPSGTPDYMAGAFSLIPAPSGVVQVSFYHQWFTDADLTHFLNDGASMLGLLEGYADPAIDVGLRPSLLQFACYNAYMRKAAEWANSVEASAGGYTLTTESRSPNWKGLAELAWKNAREKLDVYLENPLSKNGVHIRIISYRMKNWVPMS